MFQKNKKFYLNKLILISFDDIQKLNFNLAAIEKVSHQQARSDVVHLCVHFACVFPLVLFFDGLMNDQYQQSCIYDCHVGLVFSICCVFAASGHVRVTRGVFLKGDYCVFWGVLRSNRLHFRAENDPFCFSLVSVGPPALAVCSGSKSDDCSRVLAQAGVGFDQLRVERQLRCGDCGVAAALVRVAELRTGGP